MKWRCILGNYVVRTGGGWNWLTIVPHGWGISGAELSSCAVISRTVPDSAVLTFPPPPVSVAAQGVTIARLSVKLHSNDPLYRRRVQNCPELGAACQSQATDTPRHTSLPQQLECCSAGQGTPLFWLVHGAFNDAFQLRRTAWRLWRGNNIIKWCDGRIMSLLANFRKKCERKIALARPRNRWKCNVNMGDKYGVDCFQVDL